MIRHLVIAGNDPQSRGVIADNGSAIALFFGMQELHRDSGMRRNDVFHTTMTYVNAFVF